MENSNNYNRRGVLREAIDVDRFSGIVGRSENTNKYFESIRSYAVLSKEEEERLFLKMKNGTPREQRMARDKIIKHNLKLVISCAKKWAKEDDLLDITNEGNIGLIEAVDRFDVTKGFRFNTFAVWYIRKRIVEYYADAKSVVRQKNAGKIMRIARKVSKKFMQENHRKPTIDELRDLITSTSKISIEDRSTLMDVIVTSIDVNPSDYDGTNLPVGDTLEFLRSTSNGNGYESVSDTEYNSEMLNILFSQLTERERYIMCELYGIGERYKVIGKGRDVHDIGRDIGLSGERIRQVEREVLAKLKELVKKTQLAV